MKAFVTGVKGQLGHDLIKILTQRGYDCLGSGRSSACTGYQDVNYVQVDISDTEKVEAVLTEYKPDVVFHCAAWTNVDAAEEAENYDRVYAANVLGTENIAKVCRTLDCKMVYISTDYVFDGSGSKLHSPEDSDFAPLNVYGKTKLEGEFVVRNYLEKFFIVRISWLFGSNGGNFVKSIINAGRKFGKVSVVNDQIGAPTYSLDLARLLADMAETDKYGIYHASNEGTAISWYDFTCEIYRQAGVEAEVLPVSTEEYKASIAKRPSNSRLDKSKLLKNGFCLLPEWQDALRRFLRDNDI